MHGGVLQSVWDQERGLLKVGGFMLLVLDIDGTLADIRPRLKKAGKMPSRKNKKEMQKWIDKLQPVKALSKDRPIRPMQELANSIRGQMSPVTLVYLTGRSEKYRRVTEEWLQKHGFFPGPLIMRGNNDWRPARLYKEGEMKKIAEQFDSSHNVIIIDDDYDGDCSEMYRKNGWLHLKVLWGK